MKFDTENPWFLGLISLVIAVSMFFFVANDNQNNIFSQSTNEGISHSGTEVIPNVPVNAVVDESAYYVSGLPDSVTLRLDGPQSVLAQSVVTNDFEVITPNLNSLGEGVHQVELRPAGLPDQLRASISPSTVQVTIEERITENFNINAEFSEEEFLAEGHTVSNVELSQPVARVSGAASTIDRVAQVKVIIDPNETEITSDFVTTGEVVVVDESGQPLDVNYDPSSIEVSVSVEETSKELPINIVQTGSGETGYAYDFSLAEGEEQTILVQGSAPVIDELEEYDVFIDVAGVTQSTVRSVAVIKHDGIKEVSRDVVQVEVQVTEED